MMHALGNVLECSPYMDGLPNNDTSSGLDKINKLRAGIPKRNVRKENHYLGAYDLLSFYSLNTI